MYFIISQCQWDFVLFLFLCCLFVCLFVSKYPSALPSSSVPNDISLDSAKIANHPLFLQSRV